MKKFPDWPKKIAILLFWLLLWQAVSVLVQNQILLVGPIDTLRALGRLALSPTFWSAVWFSFGKISLGFFLAFFFALAAGSLAYWQPLFGEILEPAVHLMKTIPVASFVILALIWAGSKNLSVCIAFLVVFPMIYVSTVDGLKSTDKNMLEMARLFHVPTHRKIFYLYRASLFPYLSSACRTALAMGFKSGIAAEVIGVPNGSIGEGLYLAKIYLSTAELFAWTFVIIAVSAVFEKLFLFLLKRCAGKGACACDTK